MAACPVPEEMYGTQRTYWLQLFPEFQPKADQPKVKMAAADPSVLTAKQPSSDGDQKAPRADHNPNIPFIEVGTWQLSHLRRKPTFNFYPWRTTKSSGLPSVSGQVVNHDPLALARYYESLLAQKVVASRAELARFLGVSRARVTQVLHRLKDSSKPGTGQEGVDG